MTTTHMACVPADIETALTEAQALCEARGQKLTPLRRHVLRLLLEAGQPAKAYDLLQHLAGEGAAKPPTIYRALDFLRDMKLAHKIESLNAYVACGHMDHAHVAVFLICEACGKASELHAVETPLALAAEAAAAGFRVRRSVIEVQGMCADCAAKGL